MIWGRGEVGFGIASCIEDLSGRLQRRAWIDGWRKGTLWIDFQTHPGNFL
jgi:hypothetical protein